MEKVLFYNDELNDDFAKVKFKEKKDLREDFEYIPSSKIRRMHDFLFFHTFATFFGYLYLKLKLHVKIINRKVVKPYQKTGYFLYGNHTLMAGDAFTPGLITYPRKDFIITDNDSASNKTLRFFTTSLGSLPLPNNIRGLKKFHEAVLYRVNNGNPIIIYPEAHVWPYYTKIRPFKDTSFHYAVETKKPVFTFTVTYRKLHRLINKVGVRVYVDGPFFAKEELSAKENRKYLRDLAYNTMVERSKNNTYEFIKYVKQGETNNESIIN